MLKETLAKALTDIRSRLNSLEEERSALQLDLRACEAALAVFEGGAKSAPPMSGSFQRSVSVRTRSLSTVWRDILVQTARTVSANAEATSFRLADVEAAATAIDHRVSPENVRSQLATYVNRGLLARVKQGEYLFAASAIDELGELPTKLLAPQEAAPDPGPSLFGRSSWERDPTEEVAAQ